MKKYHYVIYGTKETDQTAAQLRKELLVAFPNQGVEVVDHIPQDYDRESDIVFDDYGHPKCVKKSIKTIRTTNVVQIYFRGDKIHANVYKI